MPSVMKRLKVDVKFSVSFNYNEFISFQITAISPNFSLLSNTTIYVKNRLAFYCTGLAFIKPYFSCEGYLKLKLGKNVNI